MGVDLAIRGASAEPRLALQTVAVPEILPFLDHDSWRHFGTIAASLLASLTATRRRALVAAAQ
jgi:hypothetical protein